MIKRLKKENGVSMVLVAIGAVVLFGCAALAIDVGYMYSEKARLQTAADAAAIAGAYQLDNGPEAVTESATDLAEANGVPPGGTEVTPDFEEKKVTVRVTKNAGLFLARTLGFDNADISATATAKEAPPAGVGGLLPIGIAPDDWETVYDPVTGEVNEEPVFEIKIDSHTEEASGGNFHAVDFPEGSGGSDFRDFLANGYDGYIYLGQTFDTETGSMNGPTGQGAGDRIGECTCSDPHACDTGCPVCSTLAADPDGITCPRLGIVPVLNVTFDLNGKKEVTVIAFAAIFITDVQGSKVYASFVNDIITPEGKYLSESEESVVSTVKLVD